MRLSLVRQYPIVNTPDNVRRGFVAMRNSIAELGKKPVLEVNGIAGWWEVGLILLFPDR